MIDEAKFVEIARRVLGRQNCGVGYRPHPNLPLSRGAKRQLLAYRSENCPRPDDANRCRAWGIASVARTFGVAMAARECFDRLLAGAQAVELVVFED